MQWESMGQAWYPSWCTVALQKQDKHILIRGHGRHGEWADMTMTTTTTN